MKKYIWIWLAAAFLAVFLWLQSVLLSEQEQTLSIPVIFDPQPGDLLNNDAVEPEINVILNAKGVHILLFKHQNIFYQVDGSKLKYGMNSIHLNLENLNCTEKQLEYVTGFTEKVKLIEMDRIISCQKPVTLTFTSQADEQFFSEQQLDISSNTVQLNGPEKLLGELESIKTEPVAKRDFKNNQLRVSLQSPSRLVELNTQEIVIKFNSKMKTIKTIPLIPVTYKGDKQISFSPRKVTVKIEGSDSIISNIKTNQILVELILPEKEEEIYGSLKFELPPDIKLLEYTPEKIRITRLK